MDGTFHRRHWLQGAATLTGYLATANSPVAALPRRHASGVVSGRLTGAEAIVETLQAEGCTVVYGIPGAQQNELWDTFKSKGMAYLLCTHEFSASCMADGYARVTGRPGVLAVVPGPGLTNALTGIGEALLDSIPMVAIVGEVACGDKARPFQVHALDHVGLLRPITKQVFVPTCVSEIPQTIRQAFRVAQTGEPGPTAVVIPYNLLIDKVAVESPPLPLLGLPFDAAAFDQAVGLLCRHRGRIGIYAGQGCMEHTPALVAVAEMLQAPVATSVSGKGVIPENHPLAVGWGYGPHATRTAEKVFEKVDAVLAIGVKYSEVSTGFYGDPKKPCQIHVDANAANLGRVMPTSVCVQADAGVFLHHLLGCGQYLARPVDGGLQECIRRNKHADARCHARVRAKCGIAPMQLILALRQQLPIDAALFVDVTVSEHLAAEAFTVCRSRSYFNPVNNQSMGWSIPAALGAQMAQPGRCVATLTGDGSLLMSGLELSTAARTGLPVKFFVLDDQAYEYMQQLQLPAYRRTTATVLAQLDYPSLAQGLGIAYQRIDHPAALAEGIRGALCHAGPVLVQVCIDYSDCEIRWIDAVRNRYIDELSVAQKARFLARISARTLDPRPEVSD